MKKNPRGSNQSRCHELGQSAANGTKFLASHPFGFWFWVGLVVLIPVYALFLTNSEWLRRPPKPVGDGLCYESIGYSLYSGRGFLEDYQSPEWRSLYGNDSAYADLLARSEQRVVPATGRPPVLPSLIASAYTVLDRTPDAFMWIRFGLGGCLALSGAMATGLSALLLHRITKSVATSSLGGMISIGLAASQNTLKEYTTDFLTEPIALFWLQTLITLVALWWFRVSDAGSSRAMNTKLSIVSASTDDRKGSWRWAVPIGLSIGMAVLTRSMFIFWVPLLLFLLYLMNGGSKAGRLIWASKVACVCLATCMPWWIHNCVSLGRFMPLGTQGAVAILGGYSEEAYLDMGNWSYEPELTLRRTLKPRLIELADDTEREIAISKEASSLLRKWVADNIAKLPSLFVMRAVTHWNPYTGKSALWKVLIVMGAIWVVLSYPGLRVWILGLPAISTLVVMGLYETGGRFLVPLYGHLFMLGGLSVGLVWNIGRLWYERNRQSGQVASRAN